MAATDDVTSPPRGSPSTDALGPSLTWALSRVLPGREETRLLRAILHRDDSAHEAWRDFSAWIPDLPSLFRTDRGGRKRLSPLLLTSIRENGLDADPTLLTVLRTAYLREELRAEAYGAIAGEAYEALRARGLRFLVLKGAALSETVYAEPCLRHSHDIDLLLPDNEVEDARDVLQGQGLEPGRPLPDGQGAQLRHTTDLPVLLLRRLFRLPFYGSDFGALWDARRTMESGSSGSIEVLGPADSLLHTLVHASYCPSRSNLTWVTDAWTILHGKEPVDWSLLERRSRDDLLELPAFVLLRYLREYMEAPIPDDVIDRVGDMASRAGSLNRDVALFGARQSRGKHPNLTGLTRPGWRERAALFLWQLFPSREYISWAYHEPHPALVPAIYLMRPVTFGAQALWWRLRATWTARRG